MALSIPCHYILVGRTPAPDLNADTATEIELSRSIAELKADLLKREKFSSPKALESRASLVYKQNQILLTKRKLEASGARVSYFVADLTNHAEFSTLIHDIKNDFGKLDGVIHASGHLEDKLTIDKTQASFDRVLATKLAPLSVLAEEFQPSLKYCVLFSSVTSVFGNKGQIDYGTANAVFDQFANALTKTSSSTRVIAINWGPWKGKGMIDHSLEQDFIRRGVTLISLKEGAKAFLNELLYGDGGQAILMTPVKDMSQAKEQF
jgi:NAD(P)-dependent dehydrogenase (short-subunit alcohol dehydrogenase family)